MGTCGSTCPVDGGFYSYQPSLGGNVILLAAFTSLVPAVFFLGYRHRTLAFSTTLAVAILLNLLGFTGRILLHIARHDQDYFNIFMLGNLLGPVATTSAIYFILPHILTLYGEKFCPCNPAIAGFVLHTLAAIAAVIEIIGTNFLAYTIVGMDRSQSLRIIIAGLSLQTAALVGAAVLYGWFTRGLRVNKASLDLKHFTTYNHRSFTRFLRSLELTTLLLVINSIYRIIELAGGLDGPLFQNEIAFMLMDGLTPLLCCVLLTIFYPGAAFGSSWSATSLRRGKRRAPPPPLLHPGGYNAHHKYDPNIRKQFSPGSQRSQRASLPPETPAGSPGLPASPRPTHKATNSMMHSPTSIMTAGTASSTNRYSYKSEKRNQPHYDMVDNDAIW